jgi:AraC family transcriptional regulator
VNASGRNQELSPQPTPSGERSFNKYGVAGLLASSATRGWSNLAAELRSHRGTVAWNNPQPDAEICVDVRGSRSVITRRLDGVIDSTVSERGTIWLRPAGVQEGLIDMSEPVPAILHLYLPPSLFLSDNLGEGFGRRSIHSVTRPAFAIHCLPRSPTPSCSNWNTRLPRAGCSPKPWR